ncbi:MAG: hypothetical protein GY847_26975 [Proteobacteria bacterium]|nr:hypothetical protein [Pseudomonadota bacterium]
MGGGNDIPMPTIDEWQITAVGGLDLSAFILLSFGILAAVMWTWRSLDPAHSFRIRLLITTLRALALFGAFVLLLQPAVHFRKIEDAPTELAILVDGSGSMTRGNDEARLGQVKKIVEQARSGLDELSKQHKLSWYGFAEDLIATNGSDGAISPLKKQKKTDIKSAILKLAKMHKDAPVNGIVLISDGADTEIADPEDGIWDATWARKLGVPINAVFVGSVSKHKDLAIERAEMDPFAFSRSETPIAVTLSSVGFPDREVEAFLWQDGSVVQRRTVQLVGGKGQFSFTVFPSTLGHHVLTVTVPTPPDDEVPENNKSHVAFKVIRDKFRILHLAGRPSWDQRFLRETLKSWPRVDLVSFYILRTAYQSTAFGSSGMALIPFPTEDIFEGHLDKFDIVILHSFEPVSVGVDRYLERIAEFVNKGGALVLIGGSVGLASGKMPSKAFKKILPVKLLGPGTPERRLFDTTPFRVKLTEVGANHPLMRLKPSTEKNMETWRSLTRLDIIGRVAALTDGALRLAEHPFVRADDGPAPVVAAREVGEGRTLAIATDSLWRWRFTGPMSGGPSDAYATFWRQAISWLTRAPELDRLRVKVNPSPVFVNRPTQIDIELLDETYRPMPGMAISCVINWILQDGAKASDAFQAQLDDQGCYRREWLPNVEGPHNLTVTSAEGLSSTKRFLVETQNKELNHLEPKKSLIEAIARETGGYFESGTLTPKSWKTGGGASHHILYHREIPLWDHPLAILLLIALLTSEWLLRRRIGLR